MHYWRASMEAVPPELLARYFSLDVTDIILHLLVCYSIEHYVENINHLIFILTYSL